MTHNFTNFSGQQAINQLVNGGGASVQIDMNYYMTQGAGRYATIDNVPVVQQFFQNGSSLAPGTYTVSQIQQHFQLDNGSKEFNLSHYTLDIFSDDFANRAAVFGSQDYKLSSDTLFQVGPNGELSLLNASVITQTDNFDFQSENDKIQLINDKLLQPLYDPDQLGIQFDIEFVGPAPVITELTQADYNTLRNQTVAREAADIANIGILGGESVFFPALGLGLMLKFIQDALTEYGNPFGGVTGFALDGISDFLGWLGGLQYNALVDVFEIAGLTDPLVIDLDNNGITTIDLNGSTINFDLDNNGIAETVGWIEAGDGFIAHEWSGDGVINNRSELFANFAELARHDTNNDGVINSADADAQVTGDFNGDGTDETITVGYDQLRMWIDTNSDGVTDAGELQTLASLGIAEIDLNFTEQNIPDNGNLLNALSTVTLDDGATLDAWGLALNRDTLNADYQVQVDALDLSDTYLETRMDAFALPQLSGAGNVPHLIIETLGDDALLDSLRDIADDPLDDMAQFVLKVEIFLFQWAGVDDIAPTSRGGRINARIVEAIEAFVGQSFTDGGALGLTQANLLQKGWDGFVLQTATRFAMQTAGFNPNGDVFYDWTSDSYSGDWNAFLDGLAARMLGGETSRFDNETILDMVGVLAAYAAADDEARLAEPGVDPATVQLNTPFFDDFYTDVLSVQFDPVATEFYSNSAQYDPTQNFDLLRNTDYADEIANFWGNSDPATAASEHFVSSLASVGSGGATYVIVDKDPHDFELGVNSTQAFGSNDEVFDLRTDIAGQLLDDNGVGAGDDIYAGNLGNDTYIVDQTVGFDTIIEGYDPDQGTLGSLGDTVVVNDDVILSRSGSDLFLQWAGSNNIVLIKGQFQNYGVTGNGIEYLTVVGGQTLDRDAMAQAAWYRGTNDRDGFNGSSDAETFYGGLGDDIIVSGGGKDLFVYDSGDGNDIIRDGDSTLEQNLDVLQLRDITSDGVLLSRNEDDLFITDNATGQVITVENQFRPINNQGSGGPFDGIGSISFADGVSFDRQQISDKSWVLGTDYNDDLASYSAANIYLGGLGDDVLSGGGGLDIYVYSSGDGNDTIVEDVFGDHGILRFTDLNSTDIRFTRAGPSLLIKDMTTGQTIAVASQFYDPLGRDGISGVEFANGETYDILDIENALQTVGTDGNDILNGSNSLEKLIGGLGDDTLIGKKGLDTYIYASGDGNDTIIENVGDDLGILQLADLNRADVILTRVGNDLLITDTFTNQIVSVQGQYTDVLNRRGITGIEFADGETFDRAEIDAGLHIVGTDGNDVLTGSILAEKITGGPGDDTLQGGKGLDTYIYASGDGNDTIIENFFDQNGVLQLVDLNISDIKLVRTGNQLEITDLTTGQTVTVQKQFGIPVENFGLSEIQFADGTSWDRATITSNIWILGTNANDSLTGTDNNDVFEGGLGDDSIDSGIGNDTFVYSSGDGNDFIDEGDGSTANTDVLRFLDLNVGDVTIRRSGVDLFVKDNITGQEIEIDEQFLSTTDYLGIEEIQFADGTIFDRDAINEIVSFQTTDGADTLVTTSSAELIHGGGGDDNIDAQSGNDTVYGGTGNDTIVGGAGTDMMFGGTGDDSYFVQQLGDVVSENPNEGDDVVRVYFDNYVLTDNVEELRVIGAARIASGNGLDNLIVGLGGGDELHGADGADTINGNGGGDTLFGDGGDDWLRGHSGSDTLNGGDGNDRLEGGDDIDTMNGGAGDDDLFGGGSRDFMAGGLGADRFVFDDADYGGNTFALADRILDFSQVENDSIDLRPTDADTTIAGDQAFIFLAGVGTSFTGSAGELRFIQSGGRTYVQGDTDGDGNSDFMIRLEGLTTIDAGDFLL